MIIRVQRKEKNYTIIDNGIINDRGLSHKALGLAVRLLSRSDKWEIRMAELAKTYPGGMKLIRSAFKELSALGYAELKVIHENGKANGKQWILHEQKLPKGVSQSEVRNDQKGEVTKRETSPKGACIISTDSIVSTNTILDVDITSTEFKSDPAFSITETEIDFEPFKPNQPEREKEKNSAKKEKPLVHQMFDTWSEYHERLFDEPAATDPKFWQHLKLLTTKFETRLIVKEQESAPENILENFRLFLEMIIESKESFYLTNFTPDIFNSKFTNLIQLFKSKGDGKRDRRRKENIEILEEIAARTNGVHANAAA